MSENEMDSAVILCEGAFGKPPGKTAAGLVRRSHRFKIIGVIDSTSPGIDAGELLDGVVNGIPIYPSVSKMLSDGGQRPDYLIVGVATIGGRLPDSFRDPINEALGSGIGVISGLHEYLSDDPGFRSAATSGGAEILDIRREPPLDRLRHFRNLAKDLDCVRIPVLGTDAAIGKRTTALELTDSLNEIGVESVFVATGQTGLLQGSEFGVPLDAIRGDFVVGELEGEIIRAWEERRPKVIIIEGQGSLSHPAYVTGSRAIISSSSPNGVILQHAPKRTYRTFHENELHLPMPDIGAEVELVRAIAKCPVIGIGLNHADMTRDEVSEAIREYQDRFEVPCTDVLWFGAEELAKGIARRFDLQ